jgi:hypothetical protein
MDESTDRTDTAQLLIFIRGIDDSFNLTEKIACLRSLKEKTTDQILYNEFTEGLNQLMQFLIIFVLLLQMGLPTWLEKF